MVRKRYSPQKKQEQVSRKQFEAFLEQHEWITGDIDPDLGEDIFVRIYEDGISTGLSLYIQLKSVRAIAGHQLKTGNIYYSFDVEDLIHWENQIPPAFLVIWDIDQKTGWWISARDAVRNLNKNRSNWKTKKSAVVHIPLENEINFEGLLRIRMLLAETFFSIIANGKEISIPMEFTFPNTTEGQVKRYEFERFLSAGDEVELDSQYITEFTLPDWWTRLIGKQNLQNLVIKAGTGVSTEVNPMRIDFFAPGFGQERIPYVEFRTIKQGNEETTLSNEHQNIPFKVTIILNSKAKTFTLKIKFDYAVLDGCSALQLINIQRIFAKGGDIKFTMLNSGKVSQFQIPAKSHPLPDPRFSQFIENLAAIQKRTGKVLIISNIESLTTQEMDETKELAAIVSTGQYIQKAKNYLFDIRKPGILTIRNNLQTNSQMLIRMTGEDFYFELFSERFDLGPITRTIRGTLAQSFEELSAWYEQAGDEDSFGLQLIEPEIMDEYPNWAPKHF